MLACGEDGALRDEVRLLLEADESLGEFLKRALIARPVTHHGKGGGSDRSL